MTSSLAEDYLRWLEPQTRCEQHNPEKTYWDILGIMFEKEFVWLVPHDDNRIGDGLLLRREFCEARGLPSNALSFLLGGGPSEEACSFLEVLIGISRRLAFAAGGREPMWAWQLLTNLGLHKMPDPLRPRQQRRVDDILDACVFRTYASDGSGGFFPLSWPEEDQTKVEIWYQMAAFIDEQHPEH